MYTKCIQNVFRISTNFGIGFVYILYLYIYVCVYYTYTYTLDTRISAVVIFLILHTKCIHNFCVGSNV